MTEGKNFEGRKSLLDVFSVYRRRLRWDFRGCCLIFIVIVTLPVYQQGLSTNILFCKNVTKIQKYAFLVRIQKITFFCENFLSQLYVFIIIWVFNFVKIFTCTVFTLPHRNILHHSSDLITEISEAPIRFFVVVVVSFWGFGSVLAKWGAEQNWHNWHS